MIRSRNKFLTVQILDSHSKRLPVFHFNNQYFICAEEEKDFYLRIQFNKIKTKKFSLEVFMDGVRTIKIKNEYRLKHKHMTKKFKFSSLTNTPDNQDSKTILIKLLKTNFEKIEDETPDEELIDCVEISYRDFGSLRKMGVVRKVLT